MSLYSLFFIRTTPPTTSPTLKDTSRHATPQVSRRHAQTQTQNTPAARETARSREDANSRGPIAEVPAGATTRLWGNARVVLSRVGGAGEFQKIFLGRTGCPGGVQREHIALRVRRGAIATAEVVQSAGAARRVSKETSTAPSPSLATHSWQSAPGTLRPRTTRRTHAAWA